jgi:hypothetical protein
VFEYKLGAGMKIKLRVKELREVVVIGPGIFDPLPVLVSGKIYS